MRNLDLYSKLFGSPLLSFRFSVCLSEPILFEQAKRNRNTMAMEERRSKKEHETMRVFFRRRRTHRSGGYITRNVHTTFSV